MIKIRGVSRMESWKKLINRFLPVAFLAAGILIGFLLRDTMAKRETLRPRHTELREGGFRYVNPLADCESSREAEENIELKPLENRIKKVIDDQKKRKWLSDESVYFRRLNSGQWLSVNQADFYYPASLMKFPVMMTVLKQAEVNPHLLGVQIKFSGHTDLSYLSPYFAPSKKLEGGKLYTVDELLTRMIVYSDNDALFLLVDHLGEPLVSQTFKEVGLPDPFADGHKEQEYALTVEQYVLSLRLLYNASYLSKAMSEKALGLLTEIEFRQGLVEGVPPDIPVAHKFGERVSDDSFHNKELHDCGVIYYPAHPYLLCVMTKGDSFQYLDDGIKEISQTVYEEVDRSWNIVGKKSFPENLNH